MLTGQIHIHTIRDADDNTVEAIGWTNPDDSTVILAVGNGYTQYVFLLAEDWIPASLGVRPFPDCCEEEITRV